ncbi:unnamed protein product [Phyllotreta striolata]|uniref:Uncharacterized protein n=1 Tax=Phyllotreta striolata TaxID=444603 RepID=A0A9N9XKY8_PHYSR|nr:unnamed protein product [Phyllotreta striolata]
MLKSVLIVLWTIIQTTAHIAFSLGSFFICRFDHTNYLVVVYYITYLYDYDKCGRVRVTNSTGPFGFLAGRNDVCDCAASEPSLYNITHTIAEKAQFPRYASRYFRTQVYLLLFVIIDVFWLLSSLLLLVGICCRVKRNFATVFYLPWLITAGLAVLLDVTASVHFGLDFLDIYNYTSWLRFIGVENYMDFKEFNKAPSSVYIPAASTVVLVTVWSRFVAFWILNIVNFFTISNEFTIAYKKRKNIKQTNEESIRNRIGAWNSFYDSISMKSPSASSADLHGMSADSGMVLARPNLNRTDRASTDMEICTSLPSSTAIIEDPHVM